MLDLDRMVSAFSAFYWKLYRNSVILKVKSNWERWYYNILKPNEDYIPIDSFSDIPKAMYYHKKKKQIKLNIVKALTYKYAIKTYKIR